MMKVMTECKICRKPLVVEMDGEYAELGDPNHLIPMATHNRCFDLWLRGDQLHVAFSKICMSIEIAVIHNPKHDTSQYRPALEALTKAYCKWMCDSYRLSGTDWDEEMVNIILDKPGRWHKVLDIYRRQFRERNLKPKPPVSAPAPHNDP